MPRPPGKFLVVIIYVSLISPNLGLLLLSTYLGSACCVMGIMLVSEVLILQNERHPNPNPNPNPNSPCFGSTAL